VGLVEHRGLVEGPVAGKHGVQLLAVDTVGPGADQRGGDGVAREVRQRPGLGLEAVDADDEADAVEQLAAVRGQATGEGGEPAPLTPAAPLEAITMNTSREICSPIASGLPSASAMNSEAIVS